MREEEGRDGVRARWVWDLGVGGILSDKFRPVNNDAEYILHQASVADLLSLPPSGLEVQRQWIKDLVVHPPAAGVN